MAEIRDVDIEKDADEIVIDWQLVKRVFKARWKICAVIVLVCALLAMALAFVVPKKFESEVLLRAKQKTNTGAAGGAAALILGGNMPSQVSSYIELIKSRAVIDPIIAKLDISADKKELMTADGFFKSNLQIDNPKGTDILSVTASGKSPEEAQMIASNVSANLSKLLNGLNRSDQSYMVKFLNGRIITAKKEMEQSEIEMEKFRQENKVFAPDEQVKALLARLNEFDKQRAQNKIRIEADQQTLAHINAEIAKQNIAMETYKVTQNPVIEQIRGQIITKELQLVDLRQKFTDEQPDVINTQQTIEQLKFKLDEELTKSIASETTAMNPLHYEMVGSKIKTDLDLQLAQLTFTAIDRFEQADTNDLNKLSAAGLTYIGLARRQALTQEIYVMLMKQYEQAKIQEAMDSLDVQVVDAANLPKRHVFPSKTLFTLVGGMLGGILALVSLMVSYRKMAVNK
ncbi:MAG: Wzz/FepE/Etk N-terminal domain-containing protein [Bacillota bacterium]